MRTKMKDLLLDLFFPKYCFFCQKEGNYLCQDCEALLDVSRIHQRYKTTYLSDLYYPLDYQNRFIKKLIQSFKYQPFVKELSMPLSLLIIGHLQIIEKERDFADFVLIPIPLEKSKLKWRGFNQAEEIAKALSNFLPARLATPSEAEGKIPSINSVLIKIRATLPQIELTEEERKENVKGVFEIQKSDLIKGKKILLIDDVYTTGSTMEEAARVLIKAGAKEVIGIVIARAKADDDHFKNV